MAIFDEKIEIRERCKGVHCVDLGESFPTRIYLQKSASIQPRPSPSNLFWENSIQYSFASLVAVLGFRENPGGSRGAGISGGFARAGAPRSHHARAAATEKYVFKDMRETASGRVNCFSCGGRRGGRFTRSLSRRRAASTSLARCPN